MGVLRPNRFDMRGGRAVKKRARTLRGNMTNAELVLWRELRRHQLGGRFRRQFPIPPYVVDFACVEARLIIEVDGGQHAIAGEHQRRDAYLHRHGWRILRLWNNEILANCTGVLQTITDALGSTREQSPHPNPPPLAGEGVSGPISQRPSRPLQAGEQAATPRATFPPPQAGEGVSGPISQLSSRPLQAGDG